MGIQFLRDLEHQILSDIQSDQTLKEQFIKDPTSLLKERYNLTLPDGIKLKVHQDTASEKNIVLPMDQEPVKAW